MIRCTSLRMMNVRLFIFCRYLDRYEKVHFLGEEHERGSDDDEESRHKRWSARALHSVPLTYNYQQHNIAGMGASKYRGEKSIGSHCVRQRINMRADIDPV